MKLMKRTASSLVAIITMVALILYCACLPTFSWMTYAPPPANPLVSIYTSVFENEEWYYNKLGLWRVEMTRESPSSLVCTGTVETDCTVTVGSSTGCGVTFQGRVIDMLSKRSACQAFGAVRGLLLICVAINVVALMFLAITMASSSPAHSLGAGVTLVMSFVLGFSASMLWVSLKTESDADNSDTVFKGGLSTGFILAIIAAMFNFVGAVASIFIAEKGKLKMKKSAYTLADDDEDDEATTILPSGVSQTRLVKRTSKPAKDAAGSSAATNGARAAVPE
eukprot:CAMPEP_0184697062 /NCGR_PEP_ID=MMETSP0313-20130426/4164_1 /TAXON_ID=2792 /ORGANISM="Porphyridium aerugineum, Strain SAG 1380-2" /LENGTH=279 /DNA_ID=CAMNT_0027155823 /DNA_START=131 /DNA_END=970 /DNA_ORIENTATION=-